MHCKIVMANFCCTVWLRIDSVACVFLHLVLTCSFAGTLKIS